MAKWLRSCVLIVLVVLCCILGIGFAAYSVIMHTHIVDLTPLEQYNPGKPSVLLDDAGNVWATFALDRRNPVELQHIPQHLIHAFLAAEDHAFFEHRGISWKGIVRSLLVNIWQGKIVQGASTITQQLVKLLFTDGKRTFWRKIQDQCLALFVERHFSKEYILQTYLNHVCFGNGIYGVQAACQRFWAKSVSDISLEEAALLAGIVKSPARYCPLYYPLSAKKRRNIVLRSLRSLGYITDDMYAHARAQPVTMHLAPQDTCAPHLKEMIRVYLEKAVGKKRVYTGGLTVQTTLNRTVQEAAQSAFCTHIQKLRSEKKLLFDGGLISIACHTGEIKALIGGFDFSTSQFNRAVHAHRQMGSIFKPLVYAVALQKGARFDAVEIDEPLVLTDGTAEWKPRNHTRMFEGPMTLARALAYSNNIIAIKTLLSVGFDPVIQLAKACHITSPIYAYPSLALGCIDGTLVEAVGMFNIFANHGVYVTPHYIRWVKDEFGNKILRSPIEQHEVLPSRISDQVAKVLMVGMQRAYKRNPKQWIKTEGFGKTGTTNDATTCGYVGSTPYLTTAVAIGIDDNASMGQVFASSTAFPIWKQLNMAVESPKKQFSFDPTLRTYWIHGITGMPVDPCDPEAIEIFV